MNFLLDTNICSAYLKGDRRVLNRFDQYNGGLATSAVVVGELFAWVFRAKAKPARLQGLLDMISDVAVLPLTFDVAQKYGELRAAQLDRGQLTPPIDLFIASTALLHDLTVVTHNVTDFARVPSLRVEDWLST